MARSNTKNLNDKIKETIIDGNKELVVKLVKAAKKPKKRGPRMKDPMVAFLPKLERYLILGYALSKAAQLSGLPDETVRTYYIKHRKFRESVDSLIHAPNVKARANWVTKINHGDYNASREWLAAREREDFATRTENTGKDGEPLTQPIEVVFARKKDK